MLTIYYSALTVVGLAVVVAKSKSYEDNTDIEIHLYYFFPYSYVLHSRLYFFSSREH